MQNSLIVNERSVRIGKHSNKINPSITLRQSDQLGVPFVNALVLSNLSEYCR